MKATRLMMSLGAIALVAVPIVVLAQGPGGGPADCPRGTSMGKGPGGPEGGHLGFLLGRVGDKIGLSDEQRSQIEAILGQERPALQSLREQARTAREEWQQSHDPGVFDEAAAQAFAASQAQLHADMMVAKMRVHSQVLAVLTDEQRAELEELRDLIGPKAGHRHGRRGGRR